MREAAEKVARDKRAKEMLAEQTKQKTNYMSTGRRAAQLENKEAQGYTPSERDSGGAPVTDKSKVTVSPPLSRTQEETQESYRDAGVVGRQVDRTNAANHERSALDKHIMDLFVGLISPFPPAVGVKIAQKVGDFMEGLGFKGFTGTRGEWERAVAEKGIGYMRMGGGVPGTPSAGPQQSGFFGGPVNYGTGPGTTGDRINNGGGGPPDPSGQQQAPVAPAPTPAPTAPVASAGPVLPSADMWQQGLPQQQGSVMPSYMMPQWGGSYGVIHPGVLPSGVMPTAIGQ